MHTKSMHFCLTGLLVAMVAVSGAWAQDAPDAKQILSDSMDFVAGQDALSVSASQALSFADGDQENNITLNMDISMRGTDDLYLVLALDSQEVRVIADEDGGFIYYVHDKIYQSASKVATRPQLIFGTVPPDLRPAAAWAALYLHGKSDILTIPTQFEYIARESVTVEDREIPTHRIRIHANSDVVDAWIEDGETPYLRKLTMDMSESYRKLTGVAADAHLSVTTTFTNWEIAPVFEDAQFAFVPPEGVTLPPPPGSEPLLGRMAPDIELELLDGGSMNLASHRGKEAVVLDFWTTWCPGCKTGMPIAAEVTSKHPSGKVAFYAVNLRESEDLIRQFLDNVGADPKVALDKDGAVASAYRVTSIPRSIVIDRNGRVTAGHEGVGPDYRMQLRTDIDEALAVPLDGDA